MLGKMLLAIFCWKLNNELEQFSTELECRTKEEIIASAYKIDSIFMIFEFLLEMAPDLSCRELEALCRQEKLLERLYQDWLQRPDSRNDEMLRFLADETEYLTSKEGPVKKEEGYAA